MIPKAKWAEKISREPSIGKWFHSTYWCRRCRTRHIGYQGQVLEKLSYGRWLVQLYSWLSGHATESIHVSSAETKRWLFYTSDASMRDASNDLSLRRKAFAFVEHTVKPHLLVTNPVDCEHKYKDASKSPVPYESDDSWTEHIEAETQRYL